MEQFGFDELSDDVQLLVLKYMPIMERVLFERVNSNWASLLDRLWLSQKQLQFGRDEYLDISRCHKIGPIDRCELKYMSAETMFKIISNCRTLKTLGLRKRSHPFEKRSLATELANVLNDNCKELKHLNIPYDVHDVFFEQFKPSDKFTCLLYPTYERLKLLHDRMPSPVGPMNMKLFNVLWFEYCQLSWELINKVTVEQLNAICWEDKYNELINLKYLDLGSDLSYKMDTLSKLEHIQMGTFSQLEHVTLPITSNTDLRRIFQNSPKLVSLKLLFPDGQCEVGGLMPILVEFGSNLRVLKLYQQDGVMIGDYVFWQNLAKLTKLRKLVIRGVLWNPEIVVKCKFNVNGIILLLQKCTKLKCVDINWPLKDIATEAEEEQIRRVVADKSFRQSFVASFKYRKDYLLLKVCVGQQSV